MITGKRVPPILFRATLLGTRAIEENVDVEFARALRYDQIHATVHILRGIVISVDVMLTQQGKQIDIAHKRGICTLEPREEGLLFRCAFCRFPFAQEFIVQRIAIERDVMRSKFFRRGDTLKCFDIVDKRNHKRRRLIPPFNLIIFYRIEKERKSCDLFFDVGS